MHFIAAFLVATSLASVTIAGPTRNYYNCATSECQQSNNYFYEIGRIYEYDYDVDTRTFIEGTSEETADTKVKAKVLIQPTSPCDYSLTFKDVSLVGSKKDSEFVKAVTKESIKFSFHDGKVENICASDTEPIWVLNFKKGFLSSFQNSMTELEGVEILTEKDISGVCEATYTAKKEDLITRVTREKKQSSCKEFAHSTVNKLSSFGYSAESFLNDLPLFDGKQTCEQEISNELIQKVSCEQSFLLRPFANKENGAKTEISTKLVLTSVTSGMIPTGVVYTQETSLEFQEADTNKAFKDKNTVDDLLYKLEYLTENGVTKEVPALFSELVVALRNIDANEMKTLYQQNDKKAKNFIQDALMLVGTPASMEIITNMIIEDVLQTNDQEAFISSLSFIKNPKLQMFSAIQPLFNTKIGVKALLGISSMVHNYCSKNIGCYQYSQIQIIIRSFESFLGGGCRTTSDEERTQIVVALKALGNAGIFVNAQSTLERCFTEENDMEVRIAAIEAWRRTPVSYSRESHLAAFQDRAQDNEIRIAAYLAIMVHPTKRVIDTVKEILISEGVNQVASFVWTHLSNLQESAFPEKQAVRELIGEELLQKKFNPEVLKFSRNFESSIMLDNMNIGGMTEANVIFSSQSFLPRSAMINFNVDAFGESVDLFEIGGRIEGFESFIEKFFGKDGYYPEETIEGILKNLRQQKQEEETMLESYLTKSSNNPEGSFYMKIFGNEVSYNHFHSLKELMPELGFENPMDILVELMRNGNIDYTKNFNILDADFSYPTIAGLPLKLKMNGAATLNLKVEGNFAFGGLTSMNIEGIVHPSAAITMGGSMAVDAFVTESGMKISSSMQTSSRIEGKGVVNGGKLVDFEINLPKNNDMIFEFSNELFRIEDGQEIKEELTLMTSDPYQNCINMLTLSACHELKTSLSTTASAYFPLSGSSMTKFHIKSTDSQSPIKFQYKNNDDMGTILLNVPNMAFSMTFNKRENELNFNVDNPILGSNLYGKGKYNIYGDEKEISFHIGTEQKELYGGKFLYNHEKSEKTKTLIIEVTKPTGKLAQFESTYKYDEDTNDFVLNVELSSSEFAKKFVTIDYSDTNKQLAVDVQIQPLVLKLTTDISTNGDEISWNINGKANLIDIYGPQTLTGRGSYKYESLNNGNKKFVGKLEIQEFGFNSDWHYIIGPTELDAKMSGFLMGLPFNIDFSDSQNPQNALIDMQSKILVNIPAFKTDIVYARSMFFDATKFKSNFAFKYNEFVSVMKNIHWQFEDKLETEIEINLIKIGPKINAKLNSANVDGATVINYNAYGMIQQSFAIDGSLKYINVPNRFNAEFEFESTKDTRPLYSAKVSMDADPTEMNLQGSLDTIGDSRTIFAKATPTSINVSNTFYKPISIEATIDTEGENKEIMIASSSDDHTFRAEGRISPNSLHGTIKCGNIDSGLSTTFSHGDINGEVWWSSEEKISLSVNYSNDLEKVLFVTLMTPFNGFQKQDLKIKYSFENSFDGQLSLTWGNEDHLTVTSSLKIPSEYTYSAEHKVSSTIDVLDNILYTYDATLEKGTDIKGNVKFISPFTDDLIISYKFNYSNELNFVVSYGNTEYVKIMASGDIIDLGNINGSIVFSCPYLITFDLKGKIETENAHNIIELKGEINNNEVLLVTNNEYLVDSDVFMLKSNIGFTVSSWNILTYTFDCQLLNLSEFKADIDMSSNFFISSDFNIEGHIEGNVNSFSHVTLTGYITSQDIDGRININHSITNSKLFSKLETTLNEFNLKYETTGIVDMERIEANFNGKVESSIAEINGWNLFFNHAMQGNGRKSTIQLSKDEFNFNLHHEIVFSSTMNWYNEITINDNLGMKNEFKADYFKIKFSTDVFQGSDLVTLAVKIDQTNGLLVDSSLNTPWTKPLKITVNGFSKRAVKGQVEVTYGQSKTTLEGEIDLEGRKNSGVLVVTNEMWTMKSLKIEFEYLKNTSLEVNVTDYLSRSLLFKFGRGAQKIMFKLEYTGTQTYMVQFEHEGTALEGNIETQFMVPSITSTVMVTQVFYKYKPMNWILNLNTVFNDKPYKLDFNLKNNEVRIVTQCSNYKTITSSKWKFQAKKAVLAINFEIPNIVNYSLDMFKERNSFKISFTNDQDVYVFSGVHSNNSLTIKGKTPISGYRTINFEGTASSTTSNAELIIEDRKYLLTYKFNIGSPKNGDSEIIIETPFEGYRIIKINLDYNTARNKHSLTFTTDIDSKNIINVSLQGSSEKISMKIVSPWSNKISMKTTFENHTMKMSGEYNEMNFNCTLKSVYDQKRKINVSINLTSNVEGWTTFSTTADINISGSQSPYSFVLELQQEASTWTYSNILNFDKDSFTIDILSPLIGFENISASGQYSVTGSYFKTFFLLSNRDSEINFSSSISTKKNIPEIKVKVTTPFPGFENIDFTLNGSFDEQKSLTVSAIVGETEYYTNIFLKYEKLSGRVGINFRSPFNGFKDISLNSIYNLESVTKILKLNYNWSEDNIMMDAKIGTNKIDIKFESSNPELKSFHVQGDHSKIANGYVGHGIIAKNDIEYEFLGKAMMTDNDFTVELNLPTDDLFIKGALLADGLKVTFTKGSDLFTKNYDFKINYSFKPESTYFRVITPFDFLSEVDLKLKARNNMVDASLKMTKFSENYNVILIANVAPKKSNFNVNLAMPEFFYNFNAQYDFVSEEKYIELTRETTYSRNHYMIKVLVNHTEESRGYVKIITTHPEYSFLKAEYKIQSTISLNNIDTFIAMSVNDNTINFGLKSEFSNEALTWLIETPFEQYEKVGFEFTKTSQELGARIYFGKLISIFQVVMTPGEYSINIETPFEAFSRGYLSFKHRLGNYENYAVLLVKFNDIHGELNGTLKRSWNNPQLILRLITPFEDLPLLDLTGSYDFSDHQLVTKVVYNDHRFLLSTKFDVTNSQFFINLDANIPFIGWNEINFLTNIDFADDKRIVQIYLTRDGEMKEIFLNGKLTNSEMDFNFKNSFKYIPNFKTNGSLDRSKRSLKLVTTVKDHVLDVTKSFNGITATIHTPYPKAKEVTFELVRNKKGFAINYKRNENFVKLSVTNQGKKKGFSLDIKSLIPGWELLSLTGRLELDDIRAYVSAHKNQAKVEISGNGKFSEKQGSFKLSMKTPFEKFENINVKFDYNTKRKIITFEAKSSSSDFHILLEYKRGFTVDIFVPHPAENTVVKGKLTIFKGSLVGSSRFTPFRTISLTYQIQFSKIFKVTALYQRNSIQVFKFEFEANQEAKTLHFEVHGRLFGNHSMLHIHREGFKKFTAIFNRNGKELKLDINGSGDLPRAGNLAFTIDNSFREVPKHIKGSLEVDRSSSPKKLNLKVELQGGKVYGAKVIYNGSIEKLKQGDFNIVITTPSKDRRIWKNISGEWTIKKGKIVSAKLSVGPITFKINGKLSLFDTDLIILNETTGVSRFVKWSLKFRDNGRDYYIKAGREERYVMIQLSTTYNTLYIGEITGSFRASRFMKNDLKFTDKWNISDGAISGSGSFSLGDKKGTSEYSGARDSNERAVDFKWRATTNVDGAKNMKIDLHYNLAKRSFSFEASSEGERISFDIILENFNFESSSNTAHFHLPWFRPSGDGELTLSHDFSKPLEKSIKAIGNFAGKKISYIITSKRNEQRTVLDLHGKASSVIFGSGTFDAGFDVQNINDASAHLNYKRNDDKFVNINWQRKQKNKHIEAELTFTSHLNCLPTASIRGTIDWSKGFHAVGRIEWGELNNINIKVDFSPGKLTASIKHSFSELSNIDFSFEYNLKGKEKKATLHYARGDRVVHLTFSLIAANKKTGSIDIDLKTPLDIAKHISFNGKWKRGNFNATYKRNDVQVDFEGKAEVKIKSSSFHVKFTLPNKTPIDIAFSYNLDKFISGKGKRSETLVDIDVKVLSHNIKFTVDGFRNKDKVFIEIHATLPFEKLTKFHLKLDSELNLTERVGHFEVETNEFYFKARNSFERLKNGFYARSQIDSSATSLPGLIIGFGRDGEAFIGTLGYGTDREITVSFKSKDHFRKGFSGTIDIPRHNIQNIKYEVTYGYNGPNKIQTNLKINIDDNRSIDAEFVYDSDGVKARMQSLSLGNYNIRARRSISDNHFAADFGVNDYGFTLEGNLPKNTKGFNLEGEIMGKKIMINTQYLNVNGQIQTEGKFKIETHYTEDITSYYSLALNKDLIKGLAQISYGEQKAVANVDFNLKNKFTGNASLSINEYSYSFSSDLAKVTTDSYRGDIIIKSPFNIVSMTGSFVFNNGFKDVSGNFEMDLNNYMLNIIFSHKLTNPQSTLDMLISTTAGTELKVLASYPYLLKSADIDINIQKFFNEQRTFIFNTKFAMKSLKEMSGEIEIGSSKPILKVNLESFMTANNYQGVFVTKLFNQHELSLKTNIPTNYKTDTIEVLFVLNSPLLPKVNLSAAYNTKINKSYVDLSIQSLDETFKTLITSTISISRNWYKGLNFYIEVKIPSSLGKYSISVKLPQNHSETKLATIQYDEYETSLSLEIKNAGGKLDFRSNLLNIERFDSFVYKVIVHKETVELSTEIVIYEQTHSILSKSNNENDGHILHTVILLNSPLLTTGFMKIEGSINRHYSLTNLIADVTMSNAINTYSSAVKYSYESNESNLSVKIRTPFKKYETMTFGMKFITADVSFFSIEASPLNVKAETFFGVTDNIFNAGVDIETGIETWELTKVQANIPLKGFSPKVSGKINGSTYDLEVKQNHTEFGGDLTIRYSMDVVWYEMVTDYRLKAPFHFGTTLDSNSNPHGKPVGHSITFDSSFLFLLPSFTNI